MQTIFIYSLDSRLVMCILQVRTLGPLHITRVCSHRSSNLSERLCLLRFYRNLTFLNFLSPKTECLRCHSKFTDKSVILCQKPTLKQFVVFLTKKLLEGNSVSAITTGYTLHPSMSQITNSQFFSCTSLLFSAPSVQLDR